MIAQELEVSLHMAFVEARQQRHEFITVEHLLMALLDNPSAAEVLRACSANLDDLRKSLVGFIKENTPTVGGADEVDTQPTLGFQRVIQRAIMHVQLTGSGKKEVTGANVLVAIFGEKDSHAVYFMHQQEITRLDVVNYLARYRKIGDEPTAGVPAGSARVRRVHAGSLHEFARTSTSWLGRQDRPADRAHHEIEPPRSCRRREQSAAVGEAGTARRRSPRPRPHHKTTCPRPGHSVCIARHGAAAGTRTDDFESA